MDPESSVQQARRLKRIIARLQEAYPDAHCELDYRTPLELLVATMLSAQSTDKQVNRTTQRLFHRYRTAADFANADPFELEQDVRAIGLYRNKARHIRTCCRQLVERHEGGVPQSMEELVALDGVGRKTANVVLGNAFGVNVGIVVDTHVARLSRRLGFTREKVPEKIERDLQGLVPRNYWTDFSHWLIWHGRRRCFARNPDCPQCEVVCDCPARVHFWPDDATSFESGRG